MITSIGGPMLLIGGGKMGSALLQGWLDAGLSPSDVHIVEPDSERRELLSKLGPINFADDPNGLQAELSPAVVLIAIKPQGFETVLPSYESIIGPDCLIVSIAAGKSINSIKSYFNPDQPVVRAMPNTPAAIGQGITVLCANKAVSDEQRIAAGSLLEAVGEAVWVESEDLIHPVTALSGGGPAYVFLLVESLARAGSNLGLPDDLAMRLARRTVEGAGGLLAASEQAAAILRSEVTSPGGTTQAALKVFMGDHGLQDMCNKALSAADSRSRELA